MSLAGWLPMIAILASAAAGEPVCEEEHSVRAGESLAGIARDHRGDVSAVTEILDAGNAVPGDRYHDIENPDFILPGWLLCIPPAAGSAGIDPPGRATPPDRTMRFTERSTGLAGTSWIATGYGWPPGEVVRALAGTRITAEFGADGRLTGSAGCNRYFASYTAAGDGITIGPVGTTRKACQGPEGVMEQERAYVAALETAATYSVRGRALELRSAGDALVASFEAKR